MRVASRVLEFTARRIGLPFSAPDWTTGRMWLLRFGLAPLNAPKDPADNWVWLIAHSIQIGNNNSQNSSNELRTLFSNPGLG